MSTSTWNKLPVQVLVMSLMVVYRNTRTGNSNPHRRIIGGCLLWTATRSVVALTSTSTPGSTSTSTGTLWHPCTSTGTGSQRRGLWMGQHTVPVVRVSSRRLPVFGSSNGRDSSGTTGSSDFLSPLALSVEESVHRVATLCSAEEVVITLSVSGGCDSVALFHACMECSFQPFQATHRRLQVVHFNHQQRGLESDADATFVEELCRDYQIPCTVELWQDSKTSTSTSTAVAAPFSQDSARQWRRQRLLELTQQAMTSTTTTTTTTTDTTAPKTCVGIILTAHHRDDSFESLTLKALRGVHLLNLVGMEPITPLLTKSIYLVRPWVKDFSKQDLIDYLDHRPWREDPSNASPKYLRNRVRNELIPLLQEMTDGSFLETRVPTWVHQSRELAEDLQPRVQALWGHVVVPGDHNTHDDFHWEKSCQLVESSDLSITLLVQSQTLYQWITKSVQGVSYETLQRVLDQLRNHPQRQEWIMEVGQGWSVQRRGAVLRMLGPTLTFDQEMIDRPTVIEWSWSLVVSDNNGSTTPSDNGPNNFRWSSSTSNPLILCVSSDWVDQTLNFYQTTLAEYEATKVNAITFRPPWKLSTVKLRQFLRGQGVPLHQRDDTPLLIAKHSIVAVQIRNENRQEWVVHGDFYCKENVSVAEHGPSQDGVVSSVNKIPILLGQPKSRIT